MTKHANDSARETTGTAFAALTPEPRTSEAEVGHGLTPLSTLRKRRLLDLTVLAAMVLVATVPFLNKAFHIDDVYYLQVARHILKDPWRPYDFTWISQGREHQAFENDWSPPFFKYVLAAGLLVFGEKEVPLHGIMGLFVACTAGSIYSIALRFSPRPLLTTALVILNPLFVPSQNLMLDVPMLALGLAGVACHVWGTDRGSLRLVLAGGLLAGLAVVTKYPAIIVFPLIVLYSLFRRSWLFVPALCVALVPLAAWCTQNILAHGKLHFIEPVFGGTSVSWPEYGRRIVSVLTIVGSGFFLISFVPRANLPRTAGTLTLVACLVLAGAWQLHEPEWHWLQAIEHFLFLFGGVFLFLAGLVAGCFGRNNADAAAKFDSFFLLCWLLLGWFMSLGSQFIAVRHVIWALPAGALVTTRIIMSPQVTRVWSGILGVIVATLGLSVGWADMEFANIQRLQASKGRDRFSTSPWPTYYLGEDSFAHYCSAAGFRPLLTDSSVSVQSPSIILCASSTAWSLPAELRQRSRRLYTVLNQGALPMTTMSYGVNFYRTGTADLPWGVGKPAEVYVDVYFLETSEGERP